MPDGQTYVAERRPGYAITAVETATALVGAMTRLGPASLTSLAAEAHCTRVNAFRILHTFLAAGLATQDGKRGPWRLGAGWLAVGRAALRQGAMQAAVTPLMAALARGQGMTAILTMRDGILSEVIAVEAQANASRVFAQLGQRAPLHIGPGRLLLAFAPETVQRAALDGKLAKLGPATRVDPAWILADMAHIRTRDWLITLEEVAEGVITISVPVRDLVGEVMAVLSLAASTIRMRTVRPQSFLPTLQASAASLGSVLENGPELMRH